MLKLNTPERRAATLSLSAAMLLVQLGRPAVAHASNQAYSFFDPVEIEMKRLHPDDPSPYHNVRPKGILPRYDSIESHDGLKHTIECLPKENPRSDTFLKRPSVRLLTDLANPIPVRVLTAKSNKIICKREGLFIAKRYFLFVGYATWQGNDDPYRDDAITNKNTMLDTYDKGGRNWPLVISRLHRPRKSKILSRCISSKPTWHQQASSIGFEIEQDILGETITQTLYSTPIYTKVVKLRCSTR